MHPGAAMKEKQTIRRFKSRAAFLRAARALHATAERLNHKYSVEYLSATEGGLVTRQCGQEYLRHSIVKDGHASGEIRRMPQLDPIPEGCIRFTLRYGGEGKAPECRNVQLSRWTAIHAEKQILSCAVSDDELREVMAG